MSNFLTKEELTILSRGLELYENEPVTNGMMSSVLKAVVMAGTRSEEKVKADTEADIAKANTECDKRKLGVARLRVKLLEMAMQPSEFPTHHE